jgi:EMC6
MMDPMGDIGGPAENAAVENVLVHHNLKANEIVDPYIVQLNLARLERIRSVMGITSGCIAGILGFTGLEGFGT